METVLGPVRAVIIDDERSEEDNLQLLLGKMCPNVTVVSFARTIDHAIKEIAIHRPELIFLNVQICSSEISTLLDECEAIDFKIIVVSANDQFAFQAFQLGAVDYLLKPIDLSRLVKAVYNAAQMISLQRFQTSLNELMLCLRDQDRETHKIAIATGKGYEILAINEVMYCRADGSYTHISIKDRPKLIVSKNLKYYERLFEGYQFLRAHQSCLINLRFIQAIERAEGGAVRMEDGSTMPISKNKRLELEAIIKEKNRLF